MDALLPCFLAFLFFLHLSWCSFVREQDVDVLSFIRRAGSFWGRDVRDATVAFISDAPFVHVQACTGIFVFRPSAAAQRFFRAWWDTDTPKFNHGEAVMFHVLASQATTHFLFHPPPPPSPVIPKSTTMNSPV